MAAPDLGQGMAQPALKSLIVDPSFNFTSIKSIILDNKIHRYPVFI